MGLSKIINKIKTPALLLVAKRFYTVFIGIVNFIIYLPFYFKFRSNFVRILNECGYEIIDIFIFRFGWHTELYQRPQHICENFSKNNVLVFYAKNFRKEKIRPLIEKVFNNLYLIDIDNPVLKGALMSACKKTDKAKFVHTCSTDILSTKREFKKYEKKGYNVLYEFIDDISPDLTSTKIPRSHFEKHDYLVKNKNAYIISSAKVLYDSVYEKRGAHRHLLATNGVNYEHWQQLDRIINPPFDIEAVLDEKKPIIGYVGALAIWFDYELIRKLAKERPDYNIVLLGWEYGSSFSENKITEIPNIKYLGSKPYTELKNYMKYIDVCIIPFLLNNVTAATSPVKLFEYMAAGKPSVCTDMIECRNYDAVCIAKTHDEFIEMTDYCIENSKNDELIQRLKKTALENTWEQKAVRIIELMSEKSGRIV